MPGSHNRDHIAENVSIFDFELTPDEMERLRALDRNTGYFDMVGSMSQTVLDEFGGYTFEA